MKSSWWKEQRNGTNKGKFWVLSACVNVLHNFIEMNTGGTHALKFYMFRIVYCGQKKKKNPFIAIRLVPQHLVEKLVWTFWPIQYIGDFKKHVQRQKFFSSGFLIPVKQTKLFFLVIFLGAVGRWINLWYWSAQQITAFQFKLKAKTTTWKVINVWLCSMYSLYREQAHDAWKWCIYTMNYNSK